MFGAAAMSLSSFCVVSNALRLNLFKLRDPRHDHKRRGGQAPVALPETDASPLRRTMHIQGMMCGHCEATVKKALEALPQVESAQVSHEKGTAIVSLRAPVDNAALKKAVEDEEYTVTGIE